MEPNNFYEDCADYITEDKGYWFYWMCDVCFPDKQEVTRTDLIEYLKTIADVQVKGNSVLVSLFPGEQNLAFELERVMPEVYKYLKKKGYNDITCGPEGQRARGPEGQRARGPEGQRARGTKYPVSKHGGTHSPL